MDCTQKHRQLTMEILTVVERAKENDVKAFEILYRTYRQKMAGICMNIVKEDRTVVDDLVHDAFILAFVSIGNLRDNGKFSEWLTTIVRNVSLKHVEQRDRMLLLPISSVSEEDTLMKDSVSSPDADLNYKELLELVNLLPEGYRKIFHLSVVEGFSHKEIADMLGIEPHSSSSQLSRAKRMLRRMIESGALWVVIVLFAPLAWYFVSRYGEEQGKRMADVGQGNERPNRALNDSIVEEPHHAQDTLPRICPIGIKVQNALAEDREDMVLPHDTDTVAVVLPSASVNEPLVAETEEREAQDVHVRDSVAGTVSMPRNNKLEQFMAEDTKWHLCLTGSLGSALAQNGYPFIATDMSLLPEADGPTSVLPEHVTTWEEYSKYASLVPPYNVTERIRVLGDISAHNTGKIEQKEQHSSPITFGVSLARPLGKRWGVETGIQYSLLKSTFSMGEGGYSVVDKQSVYYLGIPLRVSYDWVSYRGLSAYTSMGVTMHIPVYGKTKSDFIVDWQTVLSESTTLKPSLQWQMGVSLGVQYRFTSHTSIFAEPTFNWFIPSGGQTRTVWTEHPMMFTCPFGIRITW